MPAAVTPLAAGVLDGVLPVVVLDGFGPDSVGVEPTVVLDGLGLEPCVPAAVVADSVLVGLGVVLDDELESLPHAATARASARTVAPVAIRLVTLIIWAPWLLVIWLGGRDRVSCAGWHASAAPRARCR